MMTDEDDMADFQQPKKKSLRLSRRFSEPTSPSKMKEICKGYVPENTKKANNWSRRVFDQWREQRNSGSSSSTEDEQCPVDLLEKPNAVLLNYWLSRFVVEARREDGNPYPASTIVNLLAGLYRYSKQCDPRCPNFMDKKNPEFRELSCAQQVKFRELRKQGVGTVVKHAPVITPEEEDKLWEKKILGVDSPLALQRAVYFYLGKSFCLRGGTEQRNMKCSQLVRSSNPDSYTYVENGSKNNTGANPSEANKVVPVYADPQSCPRCLIYLLDLYLSKLPPMAREKDILYLHPKKRAPAGDLPWYDAMAVGKEKLRTFIQDMCSDAGIEEKKTNHSLRATGASAMFNAGVPDKLIRDVTGHRSTALQLYERPTVQQKQAVSRILVQGTQSFANNKDADKENSGKKSQTGESSTAATGFTFSTLSNCNINIHIGSGEEKTAQQLLEQVNN